MQQTIARPTCLNGIGLHLGKPTKVTLMPADTGRGRRFYRNGQQVESTLDTLYSTDWCTCIGTDTLNVMTIEHLMSALQALEIDNIDIFVEGNEIPILDGSAMPWVEALRNAGIIEQNKPRSYLIPDGIQRHQDGERWIEFSPSDGLNLDVEFEHPHPQIGRQSLQLTLDPEVFITQIAWARTFGFRKDHSRLMALGRALGAEPDNCLIFENRNVMVGQSLKSPDEPIRHKTLDLLGDLALLGAPLLSKITVRQPGHGLTTAALASSKFIRLDEG